MYFHYYGQLLHQQNMMQDYVRTGKTANYSITPLYLIVDAHFQFLKHDKASQIMMLTSLIHVLEMQKNLWWTCDLSQMVRVTM